jgi:uncharacterized membrane protein
VPYLISFLTIGGAWLRHLALTDQLTHVDAIFLRLNLLVLLWIAVLSANWALSRLTNTLIGYRLICVSGTCPKAGRMCT